MKIICYLFFGCLFISLPLGMCSVPQYVKLEGRQFKYNGYDFYPLVCDYSMQLIYNGSTPTLSSYYLSPQNSYGPGSSLTPSPYWPNYDFDDDTKIDAYAKLNADFARIKSMGFNAIRTHGLTITKTNPSLLDPVTLVAPVSVSGFTLKAFENIHPLWDPSRTEQNLAINPPYDYTTNANLKLLFDTYDELFAAAQANDLHVLLDISGGDLTKTVADVNDYADYLEALASHFKNNLNLMAYVLIEEPGFKPPDNHQDNTGHKKQQVCDYTSIWYDAIKSPSRGNDQNHLITVGGFEIADVLEWDPGVMKIDFFSPHIYPKILDYEGYSYNDAIDRVSGYIAWLKNNCPMPWMPGESGFSACEDTYYYNTHPWTPGWSPTPFLHPYDDGDDNEQLDFANYILAEVRNAGGSGFSWWNYQENWWTTNLNEARQEGYGLIDHLDNDKPVVGAFSGYLSSTGHTVNPGLTFPLPSNYYNPFNLPSSTYSYSGTVMEQGSTNPAKDAMIYAWTEYYVPDFTGDLIPDKVIANIYTFSDQPAGSFTLNTLNPNAILVAGNPLILIDMVTATSISAERQSFGIWPGTALPPTINLKISPYNFDLVVNNETIDASNSPKNFKGWNSIFVNTNVVIQSGGISDFVAKNEITVSPDFSAASGSEVHLYCSPIFPDCVEDLNSFLKLSASSTNSELPTISQTNKEIEVSFFPSRNYSYLSIEPNPNNGNFNIKLISNRDEKSSSLVTILDMFNKVVFQHTFELNSMNVDLSYLPKAIYCIQFKNKYDNIIKKIIIN